MLNLLEMETSLVYANRRHGDLVEKQILPKELHQLSIRHLAVAGRNRVVFGCQFKGDKFEQPALMGFHDRGGEVKLAFAPEPIQRAMKNYVGSVAVDPEGEVIAALCPTRQYDHQLAGAGWGVSGASGLWMAAVWPGRGSAAGFC